MNAQRVRDFNDLVVTESICFVVAGYHLYLPSKSSRRLLLVMFFLNSLLIVDSLGRGTIV